MANLHWQSPSVVLALLAFTVGLTPGGTDQQQQSSPPDSAAVKQIFQEDQADRDVDFDSMTEQQFKEWRARAHSHDLLHYKQMTDIITRGELHTGADFEKAAVIFQHGLKTDDYLFAHTLAVIAISKGRSQARWLAAASLDRYLHSMHQAQIYGTESLGTSAGRTDRWTQDPYNRTLIPDSLRSDLCVPDQAAQQVALQRLNEGKESPERTNGPGCL